MRSSTVAVLLLLFANVSAAEQNFCSAKDDCESALTLKPLLEEPPEFFHEQKLFFIESSGRDFLLTRQACAVESAVHNADLPQIIVAMTSPTLNAHGNNATFQIVSRFAETKVFFRHVRIEQLTENVTSISKMLSTIAAPKVIDSQDPVQPDALKTVNFSDVIRIFLIHRFGGWYSDLDMVILKPLSNLGKNVVASDTVDRDSPDSDYGTKVSNAIFHNEAGHLFLKMCIDSYHKTFNGDWGSGGPTLFQKALNALCGEHISWPLNPDLQKAENCQGMSILSPKIFYPYPWTEAPLLFENKPDAQWEDEFKKSHTVHFYATSNNRHKKVMQRKYYGKAVPAYVYLGIKTCPLSYNSEKYF